jgi:hypothetical protein
MRCWRSQVENVVAQLGKFSRRPLPTLGVPVRAQKPYPRKFLRHATERVFLDPSKRAECVRSPSVRCSFPHLLRRHSPIILSINQRAISVTNLVAVPEGKWQTAVRQFTVLKTALRNGWNRANSGRCGEGR